MFKYLFALFFAAAVFFVIFFIYNNLLTVRKYRVFTQKKINPLRIVLISDLHNKRFGKNNSRLLEKIKECAPDMIIICGDSVDRRRPDFDVTRDFLNALPEISDTYVITGNHERALGVSECITKLKCERLLLDNDYKILYDYIKLVKIFQYYI